MFVREYYPYTFFMSELEPLYNFHMVFVTETYNKEINLAKALYNYCYTSCMYKIVMENGLTL